MTEQRILEGIQALRDGITELRAEVRGINERLDRLNGSVAKHEEAITKLRINAAVAEQSQSRIDGIEHVVNEISRKLAAASGGLIASGLIGRALLALTSAAIGALLTEVAK